MLSLLGRRARAQWPLLAALLVVVLAGATLLGTCALLLTRTGEQALEIAMRRAAPADVDVTGYVGTVHGPDARAVVADTRTLVSSALAPFPATTAARASSVMRSLPRAEATSAVPAETYLAGLDDLPARSRLIDGRWPRPAGTSGTGPLEAVLLEPTAHALGLTPGATVHIGPELARDPAPALDVTVVGIVRPLPGTGWERDSFGAAGYDLNFVDSRFEQPIHAYGPFLVDLADLLAGGSTIDRLEITAHPDLTTASRSELDTAAGTLRGADRQLARVLGDRVQLERVASQLPQTLVAANDQQRVTAAMVLAVGLLGIVLTGTALALAGRLTAGVREGETGLLSALGLSPGQLAAAASVEAGVLAVVAAVLAVPASADLHAGLTHLPPLAGAGLSVRPHVTGVQVLAVIVAALGLAGVLVLLAVRPLPAVSERPSRRELLARSGVDLLLVAFAAVGWWQLRAQPTGASSRADVIRVVAPALLLIAGAALALRLAGPALRVADRLARRARGLVLPLAAFEAARRPQAVAAGLLIALAGAAGTFGIAFDATWQRAQYDQADVSVGTDLVIALTSAPVAGQGAAVLTATGGVVSPVTDRGIAVGQFLGSAGDAPRLVAVDTTRAGPLLRGRLDGGRSWADVGTRLAPSTPVAGIPIPADAVLTLTGTATGVLPVTVTPKLLLQDATGLRVPCVGDPVPLDGRSHALPACATTPGLSLVAVSLPVVADFQVFSGSGPDGGPGGGLDGGIDGTGPDGGVDGGGPDAGGTDRGGTDGGAPDGGGGFDAVDRPSSISVTLTVPGSAETGAWTAMSPPPAPEQVDRPTVAVTGAGTSTAVTMTASVNLLGPEHAARALVATAFPAPGPLPVAVSRRFADELGAQTGAQLTLTVGTTPVPVVVTEVLTTVPSAPGAAAVLADVDALSRALVVNGDLAFPVDAWWVGQPSQVDAAGRARSLYLGTVATRADETARLATGPLRAGLPAALRLLVPAAALLLLAGVVLHVTCDLQLRALEVARLRGLGMYRREIRRVLLGQHAGVLLPLIAAGAVVGALATRLVAPLLVRSDTGALAVPGPQTVWPWVAEGAFLALLLAGCALAVTVVVAVQARRADVAHLRVDS